MKTKKSAKQPWEMTVYQYIDTKKVNIMPITSSQRRATRKRIANLKEKHFVIIKRALSEGKLVPDEVLKNYSDLTKKGEIVK